MENLLISIAQQRTQISHSWKEADSSDTRKFENELTYELQGSESHCCIEK